MARAAASAESNKEDAFAAARAAVRSRAHVGGMGIGEILAYAKDFTRKLPESLEQVREAMLRCRANGEADLTIRRVGREAAASAAAWTKVDALARDIAARFTRGVHLREEAYETIVAKAWDAHKDGKDVRQAATVAAKVWRRRRDIAKKKQREVVKSVGPVKGRSVPMRLIRQRNEKDCGVACVAMLAGVSYPNAKKMIFGTETAGLVGASDVRSALEAFGHVPGRSLTPLRGRDYRTLPGPAILKVNPRANGEWHWIVWNGKRVLDPKKKPYLLSNLRPVAYMTVK